MTQEAQNVVRIIAHRIPWPDDNKTRPALDLHWKVTVEGSDEVLIESTKRPFDDGAAEILTRGGDPDSLYTMRHADRDYDSFVPVRLEDAAKPTMKRRADFAKFKAKLDAKAQNTENDADEEPEAPEA